MAPFQKRGSIKNPFLRRNQQMKYIINYILNALYSLISKFSSSEENNRSAATTSTTTTTSRDGSITSDSNNTTLNHSKVAGGDINIFGSDKNDSNAVMILFVSLLYFIIAAIFVVVVLHLFF
jgi:hypothetical protein